ncbi:MAG: hypothetical protein HQ495_10810 [Alphaproteobacteria bacterium]|nr:hypothetical protein [Alphaproteobacteria bacterium]
MSDLSSSSPAPSPTNRVTPAPVTAGQAGQQQAPPQGGPQGGPGGEVYAPPDTAVTLAPTLAGFVEGDQIAVAVLAQDAAGHQIIQAPGSVLVSLDPETLPEAATVQIRVVSLSSDHIRAAILSVDGEALETSHPLRLRVVEVTFPRPTSAPTAGVATGPPQTTDGPPADLRVGTVVRGQFFAPAANDLGAKVLAGIPLAGSASPAAPAPFASGTIVPWRIVSFAPPITTTTGQIGTVAGQPTPRTPSINEAVSTSNSTVVPTTNVGPGRGARPNLNAPAGGAAVAAPTITLNVAHGPAPLIGVVAQPVRADQTVVATPAGIIVLAHATPANWPEGTTVALEAIDQRRTARATLAAAAPSVEIAAAARPLDQFLMKLGEDWPALRELATQTAIASPAAAHAFVQAKVPAADSRAAAQIMFFLSVLRTGDIAGWLGNDVVRALERSGQRSLIERLGDDFRQLRRLGDESSASDWRLLLFPFAEGERIEPIHMFVRGQRRDRQGDDNDLRFVVDLRMSAIGAVQLDGLLRGHRLDLIVRSHSDLADARRRDITQIFSSGLEVIGYRGGVTFQTVREFPLSPFNDLLGNRHTPGAVLA